MATIEHISSAGLGNLPMGLQVESLTGVAALPIVLARGEMQGILRVNTPDDATVLRPGAAVVVRVAHDATVLRPGAAVVVRVAPAQVRAYRK